jgi:hypothetical protein
MNMYLRSDCTNSNASLLLILVELNIPEVVAEVSERFERYEAALAANNIDIMDDSFWNNNATVRYSFEDRQYGFDAIHAHRLKPAPFRVKGERKRLELSTFGKDLATVNIDFVFGANQIGRQSQTWVRFPDGLGWKVVAAHASVETVPKME